MPLIAHRRTALLLSAALLGAAGCASAAPARYSRSQAARATPAAGAPASETPGLLLGDFALAGKPVLDGDTIRVKGLDATLRLIGLDAEETIKSKKSAAAVESDFDLYLRERRGGSVHPVKSGTPMGDAAKEFAIEFFAGVKTVRLERDHPKEIRDTYNRYLAYVFVERGGRWVNYNVECVRAGMSPYFSKYSYSRRFHDQFVAAEAEARAAHRGIWAPGAEAYADYDERRAWWTARAEFIRAFEREAVAKPDRYVILSQWDALDRLKALKGREITALGLITSVHPGDSGPPRVQLGHAMGASVAAVFFDRDVFEASGVARYKGEFVKVSGVVSEYENRHTHQKQLQLIVSLPSQVVGNEVPGLAPRPTTAGP